MKQVKVSPAQFDAMMRELLWSEIEQYGPEACVIHACNAAGIAPPKPFEPLEIVVDLRLEAADEIERLRAELDLRGDEKRRRAGEVDNERLFRDVCKQRDYYRAALVEALALLEANDALKANTIISYILSAKR